jgi:hypothetical protein
MSGAENSWSPVKAVEPIAWSLVAILVGLVLLANPRRIHPWLALCAVSIPTLYAFKTSNELFPDATIEENYLRFVLLYIVHMSHLFLLSGPQNPVSTLILPGRPRCIVVVDACRTTIQAAASVRE